MPAVTLERPSAINVTLSGGAASVAVSLSSVSIGLSGPSGTSDHSLLANLGRDDHLQYLRTDGSRSLTAAWAANARIYDAGAALNLGAAAATSHGLGTGAVLAGGALEVDGLAYLDAGALVANGTYLAWSDVGLRRAATGILEVSDGGATNFGALRVGTGSAATTLTSGGALNLGAALHSLADGGAITFGGTGGGATATNLYADTSLGQIALHLGSALGRQLVLGDRAAYGQDYGHATGTDPALYIHSATSPNSATDQWIGLRHDQGVGHLETGKGVLNLGTAAVSSHALGVGAVLAGGALEVDGQLYVDVGATVTGNIAVTGTVDGRDVSNDGATLDALNTNALLKDGSRALTAAWAANARIYDAAAALNLGTLASTSHGLGTGAVLAGGALEVDGMLYADASATVTGNVAVTGTVDGRDVSVDGASLDSHIADGTVHSKNVDVQTFTSSGTWTKPAGAKAVVVICIGGGGGGGSGKRDAAGTTRTGGSGGGGGAVTIGEYLASQLGTTETVTVGTGGTGGAARTSDGVNGFGGGGGTISSFGTWQNAGGGGGGTGGRAILTNGGGGGGANGSAPSADGTGTGGNPPGPTNAFAISGQGASNFGGGGGIGAEWGGAGGGTAAVLAGNSGGASIFGAGGGGSGGTITSGDSATDGGTGGSSGTFLPIGGTAGTAGSNGGDGSPNTTTKRAYCGDSGGGGGASKTAPAGAGGNGGIPGGAGGGGGASLNGFNSGKGGDGARGEVRVITYF